MSKNSTEARSCCAIAHDATRHCKTFPPINRIMPRARLVTRIVPKVRPHSSSLTSHFSDQ